ncbi:uncharacterized protein [Apostichopus japonicus]|uniref:uncharacterized protein n=1 Tax=Stichopus japonicus TaxID=307972 RepID=UPI003AB228BE
MEKKHVYGIGGAVVIGVVGIIILIATSLKTLQSDEMALMYNTISRTLYEEVKEEGLHSGPPGFKFIIFPAVFRTISYDSLYCLNKDGVVVTLSIAFQYKVNQETLIYTVLQFKDHDTFKRAIENSAESAIHEACSQYNTTEFQSIREEFQITVRQFVRERLDGINCTVSDLQVNNIARPIEYEDAVKSKEAARENIQVAETERPRQLTQANTVLREAETQAVIDINRAETDGRISRNAAVAQAEAILAQYEAEANAFANIIIEQDLTTDGLMAYLGVRVVSEAANPVYAGIEPPAKTSYLGGN